MSKAVVDPDDLRRFASDLKRFNTELARNAQVIHTRFNALGETWRDQEQKKFADEFEQMLRALTRFTRATDEQVPFLMRKAERIEDYLNQR